MFNIFMPIFISNGAQGKTIKILSKLYAVDYNKLLGVGAACKGCVVVVKCPASGALVMSRSV